MRPARSNKPGRIAYALWAFGSILGGFLVTAAVAQSCGQRAAPGKSSSRVVWGVHGFLVRGAIADGIGRCDITWVALGLETDETARSLAEGSLYGASAGPGLACFNRKAQTGVPSWSWSNDRWSLVHSEAENKVSITQAGFGITRHDIGIGWPFIAFALNLEGPATAVTVHAGRVRTGWPADQRIFAWKPAWRGLLLDTAIYSILVWVFCGGAFHAGLRYRRHLRLRRNHCPTCNYNLRGLSPSSPCPECGRSPA
jgi:hypothetical protein